MKSVFSLPISEWNTSQRTPELVSRRPQPSTSVPADERHDVLDLCLDAPLLSGVVHARLPMNVLGRDFFVGDLHGQFGMLRHLLRHVEFDVRRDRLICVGDFLDRGPDAAMLLELYAAGALHSVIGNHEAMYIVGTLNPHPREHSRERSLPGLDHDRYVAIARTMPLTLEVELPDGRIAGVVHAEVENEDWSALRQAVPLVADATTIDRPGSACRALWGRSRGKHLLDGRRPPGSTTISGVDLVISGHSGVPGDVWRYGNQIVLESLAFLSVGAMTLFEPVAGRYWRTPHPRPGAVPPVEDVPPPEDLSLDPELR